MDKNLYIQLQSSLRQFSLNELYDYAINQIQDLNWDDILQGYRDVKKQLGRKEAVDVIIQEITKLELDVSVIQEIIQNLNLLAVGLSKTKTWNTYKLLEPQTKKPSNVVEVNTRLNRRFRSSNINTEIYTIDHEGKFFISISKKTSSKKNSGVVRVAYPTFIIFQPTTDYIFTTKVLTPESFNIALVRALGYQKLKIIKLSGKNPTELLKLLLYKDTNRTKIAYNEPMYNPTIKTTTSVVDFTRNKEKTDYANEVFEQNESETGLQTLTFLVRKPCVSRLLQGEEIEARMTLMAPNIRNMIVDLVAKGVIDTPVPDYLTNALKQGKNILQIDSVD